MHRIVMTSFFTLVACGATVAWDTAQPTQTAESRALCERLSRILASWRRAVEAEKVRPVSERERIRSQLSALAGECPVGSRMRPTLLAARDVLSAVMECDEANAKSCPLSKATPEQKQSEAFAAGEAIAKEHARLVHELHELSTHAVGALGDGGPPEKEEDLGARLAALEVSWQAVDQEMRYFPAARRQEMAATFETLAASCKAVTLFPSTVVALAEGFDSLVSIDERVERWAQENAAMLQSVPEDAKQAFQGNVTLVKGARDILRHAARTMLANAPGSETPAEPEMPEMPKMPPPQREHEWLRQLAGEWETEVEANMGPGTSAVKFRGKESARSIGGFWIVAESQGSIMDMAYTGILTVGYDVEKKRYVAVWVDSMTGHLWEYVGSLDSAGKSLTLETEGPCPMTPGRQSKFREVIEIRGKDRRTFTSSIQGEDGKWTQILKVDYRRKA